MVVELTDDNFEDKVIKSEKTVIIDFFATWCGPCQMQSPIIDQIAEENSEVLVGKIDVDNNPIVSEKYQIMSIPTILIIKNGEVAHQFVGLTSKEEILEQL